MITLKTFTWMDGIYEITSQQGDNGFHSIHARNTLTNLIDFAATDYTAEDCKRSIYEFIHAK